MDKIKINYISKSCWIRLEKLCGYMYLIISTLMDLINILQNSQIKSVNFGKIGFNWNIYQIQKISEAQQSTAQNNRWKKLENVQNFKKKTEIGSICRIGRLSSALSAYWLVVCRIGKQNPDLQLFFRIFCNKKLIFKFK